MDHTSYVKHVLGRIYMFFTLFGYYGGGVSQGIGAQPGGISQGIGAQPADAVFHPGQLKNQSFRNLFFWYCDHSKWPLKLCKAYFRPYLHVFHLIWVLGPGGGGGGGGSQGMGTQPAYAVFHPE